MKQAIFCCTILFCFEGLSGQVTIPSKYLSKSMKNIEGFNWSNALHDSTDNPSIPKFYWLPTIKNIDFFEKEAPNFFQKNIVAYNDSLSNISLYSEIASDFLGPVRVSAGISLAYPKTDTNSVAQQKINRDRFIQRFSTGGGTLVFNFILPIYSFDSKIFSTVMSFGPRFSIDPPSFGVSTGKFAHNTAIGADIQTELRGIKNIFTFYGNARISCIAGNSVFYDALDLQKDNRKGFWLNNYTIGVNIKDVFTLSYTQFWGSKSVTDKLGSYLTFTIEPSFK